MATRKSTRKVSKRAKKSRSAATAKRTAAGRKATVRKGTKAAGRKGKTAKGKAPGAAVRRAKTTKRGASKGAAARSKTAKAGARKRAASPSTAVKAGKRAVSKRTRRSDARAETGPPSSGSVSSTVGKRRRAPTRGEAATTRDTDESRIGRRAGPERASRQPLPRGETRVTRGFGAERAPLEGLRTGLEEIEASIKVLKKAVRRLEKTPAQELDAMAQGDLKKRADAMEAGFLAIDDLENLKLQLLNEAFDSQREELLGATNSLANALEDLQDTVAFIGAVASAIGIVANIISVVK